MAAVECADVTDGLIGADGSWLTNLSEGVEVDGLIRL